MGDRMRAWVGVCKVESGAQLMGTRVAGDCWWSRTVATF